MTGEFIGLLEVKTFRWWIYLFTNWWARFDISLCIWRLLWYLWRFCRVKFCLQLTSMIRSHILIWTTLEFVWVGGILLNIYWCYESSLFMTVFVYSICWKIGQWAKYSERLTFIWNDDHGCYCGYGANYQFDLFGSLWYQVIVNLGILEEVSMFLVFWCVVLAKAENKITDDVEWEYPMVWASKDVYHCPNCHSFFFSWMVL